MVVALLQSYVIGCKEVVATFKKKKAGDMAEIQTPSRGACGILH